MSGAEVLELLRWLVTLGEATEKVIPLAMQRHPELRSDGLPDAEGEMLRVRKAAEERS